jgi:hypothetical protein
MTAEKARKRAEEILDLVRRKVDPFDDARAKITEDVERKKQEKAAHAVATRLSFSTFADRFVDKHAKIIQPRTWKDTDSIVRRDLKPFFGAPLPAITPKPTRSKSQNLCGATLAPGDAGPPRRHAARPNLPNDGQATTRPPTRAVLSAD